MSIGMTMYLEVIICLFIFPPLLILETFLTCEESLIGPVCDKNNNQHNTLCEILFTKEEIDYKGYCQVQYT